MAAIIVGILNPVKLTNNPIKELPETILKCTYLEVLDVKENFTKHCTITCDLICDAQ